MSSIKQEVQEEDHQIKDLKKNLSFDHGVQYISPKSKFLKNILKSFIKKKY